MARTGVVCGGCPMTPKKKGPTPKRPRIHLTVIPKPDPTTRTVIENIPVGGIPGQGRLIMECGNCGAPLLKGVSLEQVENIVFLCKGCGAYNEALN